jgi:plasmid replication initiation protein
MVRRTPPKGDFQPDLFAANFVDIAVRDTRETMERPFFSLAKKPRLKPIQYQVGNVWIEVSANPQFGMATIWDADILIWASTQITETLDRGGTPGRTIKFHPFNLLQSIRRSTGGADYERLRAALERLTHSAVRTNIRAEGRKKFASFHWLESWTETIDEKTREPTGMTITLPEWLYDGIVGGGGVLTIHEDYFLLTGGIERWLYRVARKHAGKQKDGWNFTMRQLFEKSGSSARFSDFAIDIRKAVLANQIPEYVFSLSKDFEGEEAVHILPRMHLGEGEALREWVSLPGRHTSAGRTARVNEINALASTESGD